MRSPLRSTFFCAQACGPSCSAGLIGYFFKSKFGKEEDDIDDAVVRDPLNSASWLTPGLVGQFNKSDYRHQSIMLEDDNDRMSMRSGSAAGTYNAAGVGRSVCSHALKVSD